MSRVNDVDVNLINDRAFDTVRRVNGENIDSVSQNIESSNQYYDYVSTGATQRAFSTNAAASRLIYHKNTDLIAQMNESWNKNRHFNLTLQNEATRLSKGNKTAKVDVYKMRQEELQLEYTREYAKVMTKIMLVTMLSIALMVIFVALYRIGKIKKMAVVILAVVVAFYYTISVMSHIGGLARRRALDWERYYWKSKLAGESGDCGNHFPHMTDRIAMRMIMMDVSAIFIAKQIDIFNEVRKIQYAIYVKITSQVVQDDVMPVEYKDFVDFIKSLSVDDDDPLYPPRRAPCV